MSSNKNNKLIAIQDADFKTYRPGEVILDSTSSDSSNIGLITRGVVSCWYADKLDPDTQTQHRLFEDDWVGIEMIDHRNSQVIWSAEDICMIAFLSIEKVLRRGLVELTESLFLSLIRQKKQAMNQVLRSRLPAGIRLERSIMDIAAVSGVETDEGLLIEHLDRRRLANSACVGREYTSRHITRLKEAGRIEIRSRGVLIKAKTLGVA